MVLAQYILEIGVNADHAGYLIAGAEVNLLIGRVEIAIWQEQVGPAIFIVEKVTVISLAYESPGQ